MGIFSVSWIMGADRRGVIVAGAATWVAVLLCVITPMHAVEGKRWAETGTGGISLRPVGAG